MKMASELRTKLHSIDHRGYPAYKELRGEYDFGEYVLSIDHVQGDPFAAPSRVSVRVPMQKAGFAEKWYDEKAKRIAMQDHLTRLFGRELKNGSFQAKGSGKSGLLAVSFCGQQVLERTACRVSKMQVSLKKCFLEFYRTAFVRACIFPESTKKHLQGRLRFVRTSRRSADNYP